MSSASLASSPSSTPPAASPGAKSADDGSDAKAESTSASSSTYDGNESEAVRLLVRNSRNEEKEDPAGSFIRKPASKASKAPVSFANKRNPKSGVGAKAGNSRFAPQMHAPPGESNEKTNKKLEVSETFQSGTILGNYEIHHVLGRGGFSTVYEAENINDGKLVAVKSQILKLLSKDHLEAIEAEVKLMERLKHPNIVGYVEAFRHHTSHTFNIVLENCDQGSVLSLMKKADGRLPEPLVQKVIRDTLQALVYLHSLRVAHRDIKGANILLSLDGQVKLADFGVAAEVTATRPRAASGVIKDTLTLRGDSESPVGTPYWMAPEIIEMNPRQNCACDIWSIGCTIIELLTGKPPYFDMKQMPAMFRIVQDPHPPFPPDLTHSCKDFLLECFQKDMDRRCSAAKLLTHPWLQQQLTSE